MERQLIKVAKELNVSLQAVVEQLHDKGFDIESKPNAKVTDAMYDAVVKKFSDSKAEKLKADQLVIGTRSMHHAPPQQQQTSNRPNVSSITRPPMEHKTISLSPLTGKVDEKPAVIDRPKVEVNIGVNKVDITPKQPEPTPKVEEKPVAIKEVNIEAKTEAVAPVKPEDKPTQPNNDRRNEQRPNNDRRNEQRPNNDRRNEQRPKNDRRNEQRPNN